MVLVFTLLADSKFRNHQIDPKKHKIYVEIHNFCIDCCANEPDFLPTITNCMPLDGFDYLPTRIGDRDDSVSFIESSVLHPCYVRDVIVDYIKHQNFVRPTYNVIRNSGSVNNNDDNVITLSYNFLLNTGLSDIVASKEAICMFVHLLELPSYS